MTVRRFFQTGQRFTPTAAAFNDYESAAEFARGQRAQPDAARQFREASRDLVLVRNDSGADVPMFGALGFDGELFDAADGEAWWQQRALRGSVPASSTHSGGAWGVAIEPIADGAIGRVQVAGVVPFLLRDGLVTDEYADLHDGTHDLESRSTPGRVRVLWSEAPGTDARKALGVFVGVATDPAERWGIITALPTSLGGLYTMADAAWNPTADGGAGAWEAIAKSSFSARNGVENPTPRGEVGGTGPPGTTFTPVLLRVGLCVRCTLDGGGFYRFSLANGGDGACP